MRTFEQDFPSHPRVLILDGAVHPEFYRPIAHWTKHLRDVQWEAVSLVCGQTIESLEGFTHLIVTGSEDRIVSPRPWHEVEAKLVRLAAQRGMAILGSCFGHQMLARELMTGRHAVASRTPEMGWLPIERLDNKTTEKAKDGLLAGLPDPFYVFCSHFDEVIDVEPPWRALARSAHCGVQVMRWGNRPVWGVHALAAH
jgi:GMP synthase (glutamine-hydrolysing)